MSCLSVDFTLYEDVIGTPSEIILRAPICSNTAKQSMMGYVSEERATWILLILLNQNTNTKKQKEDTVLICQAFDLTVYLLHVV